MTAQISQIRIVADGTAKFRPTEQNGGSTCAGLFETPSRSVTRYQAVFEVAGRRR
jgi:hypothetical protein